MSYLALYRKYRPSRFEDVSGQDTTVRILRNQIVTGRIGHAYLFSGIRGTGKTVPPMVVMLLALCLFRILWIQFVVPHFTSIDIIYVLYPVSWAVGMVLMLIYAWKGNWMPKKYQNINQTV